MLPTAKGKKNPAAEKIINHEAARHLVPAEKRSYIDTISAILGVSVSGACPAG